MTAIIGLLLAAAAPAAHAQEAAEAPYTELVLTPRAVEQPLMKYRLMPAEFELKDGNAAPILLRLPWEQIPYFREIVPTFSDYLELPLDDPKVAAAEEVLTSRFYDELKRAAYRRSVDWEYPIGEHPAVEILLPDAQGFRSIVGRGLSVRIRSQIARARIDEAMEGIKVGFAVTRHIAQTPFLVVQAVGAALDNMMLDRTEELIRAEEGPNLYWALTALPRPLVNARPAFEFEQRILEMSVDGLDDFDRAVDQRAWIDREEALFRLYSLMTSDESLAGERLENVLGLILRRARAELHELLNIDAQVVSAMSDAEARLRWLMFYHRRQSEEMAALAALEPPSAIPALARFERNQIEFANSIALPWLLAVENPTRLYAAMYRGDRRINALRIVEAIRNYAAMHDGKLPPSLDAITETPAPDDPFTARPFEYRLDGEAATLTAEGIEAGGQPIGEIRYRLSIRK